MANKKSSPMNDSPTIGGRSRSDMDAMEKKYRAEDALRTLTRADEIRRDTGLMRDVKAHAKNQIKTVGRVLGKPKRT